MSKQNQSDEPQYLYLTTIGRKTGLPREIEIWFVSFDSKYFILAGHRENAHWVKNIRANPRVRVRVDDHTFDATARVLDKERDRAVYEKAQRLERAKYGWGAGLPVEITPDESP
jgi:deazaflavin-dependent oxidoreductase (nitroreductase family)